ncbi:TVP38/TMEM64 family protein [Alicyclobacillus tolerans]|uniref:TVP38/TMEM64 family membrane protein n=2 Tax=Alicyclobacillus tolerans TaxID=90970 RepID=A0ABT9LVF5_9BACL|nr:MULTISPECIES: VTT domain-containing protein [Alicyclobacillus]MDP9728237.1 putative membrane protein YdjX (TVP38/TMEM64 family) [Alicyclobacillus tengchongensis]QRF23451.1 TVP38/TMEM64 family protein [Alicyclobacillus sp. TC]SHJ81772.1 Uncharacterized membrane protein YdjX, TVP38/TMEM64 family, SNARE-associated domain [Alicyclobacillus montanus]
MSTIGKALSWKSLAIFLVGVAIFVAALYADRHHQLSNILKSWGWLGIGAAILLMVFFCMTPIPSEGLLVMYLKVYGIGWGIFYAWLGSTLSALLIYILARTLGVPVIRRFVSEEKWQQVNGWVERKGGLGLLFARLLPIPAFVVNYAAGMMSSVSLWTYVWTAAISIVPYYIGVSLVYAGIMGNNLYLLVGIIPILIVGAGGYWLHQQTKKRTYS